MSGQLSSCLGDAIFFRSIPDTWITDYTGPLRQDSCRVYRYFTLRELQDEMTRPYSVAFKQKMIHRLTGKHAVSASQLARQTGVRQQNPSRWLAEARSRPLVATDNRIVREWAVEQKARVLAEALTLIVEARPVTGPRFYFLTR